MIIYNEPSSRFLEHILDNEIGYVLQKNVKHLMNKFISASELRLWGNSLPQMALCSLSLILGTYSMNTIQQLYNSTKRINTYTI